jgi:hypothetical protein
VESLLTRGPEVLGNLWDKAGRAGRLEVMREVVYDMISTLRVDGVHERREFKPLRRKRQRRAISKAPYCRSLEGISRVQALREGLETRLCRRVALTQLHAFLYPQQNQEFSVKSLTGSRKRKRVMRQDSFGIRLLGTGTRLLTATRVAGYCSFFLSRVPRLGRHRLEMFREEERVDTRPASEHC